MNSRLFCALLMVAGFCLPLIGRAAPPAAHDSETKGAMPEREKFHLYLLIGQSNMAGRGPLAGAAALSHERVLKFTAGHTWEPGVEPLHFDKPVAGAGLGASFARVLADAEPGVTIGLIPCAVGGTPIERWLKGRDLYEQALKRALFAMKDGTLKGILWHQGESDSGTEAGARAYGQHLEAMIGSFRADLGNVPFVAGELGGFLQPEKSAGKPRFAGVVNEQMEALEKRVPAYGVARADGLKDKGDTLHFDTESVREFGKRYAEIMLRLQKP